MGDGERTVIYGAVASTLKMLCVLCSCCSCDVVRCTGGAHSDRAAAL